MNDIELVHQKSYSFQGLSKILDIPKETVQILAIYNDKMVIVLHFALISFSRMDNYFYLAFYMCQIRNPQNVYYKEKLHRFVSQRDFFHDDSKNLIKCR